MTTGRARRAGLAALVQPWGLALLAVACAACAPGTAAREVVVPASTVQGDGNRDRLARDEEALLAELSVGDARLAKRFEMPLTSGDAGEAALHAILAEDPGTQIVDGRVDAFSFATRGRVLEGAQKRIDGWTYPLVADAALERELLLRLVLEERARLEEERDLPRSASELVRGALATWTTPEGEVHLKERDAWLARRLDEVRATLRDGGLSTLELEELDDALDALEHKADGYAEAQAALTRLRVRLDEVPPAKAIDGRWEDLHARLHAHVGLDVDPARARASLEAAASALKQQIKARRAALHEDDARREELHAEARVLAEGRCAPKEHGVRGFLPPPERGAVCGALEGLQRAGGRDDLLLPELMALHDDVIVALWALAIHAEGATPEQAAARYRPVSFFPPEREARLLRLAAVRATAAVGAGLGVAFLARGGDGEMRARAERWLAFGDAPLDVIAARVK